ncbi:MAG: class I SAM-dependent methyltransferase [Candidatus Latescibacteria bacterium]|nr:class I SAM-dependent methyltransferase [Candidatus Latescibacterota bacterium]
MSYQEAVASEVRETNRTFYADYYHRPLFNLRYEYLYRRQLFTETLLKLGIPRSGQRVLDAGFGYGDLLFLFDPSCDLHGLEISPSAVEQARARAASGGYAQATFTEHDLHNLIPYADDTFDVAICSHTLEHIENTDDVVADFYRVLKAQGVLFVFLPINEESFHCEKSKHIWKFTTDNFCQMAERCGFRTVSVLEHQFFDMPFKAFVPFGRRHPVFDVLRRIVQYTLGLFIVRVGGRRIDQLLERLHCPATCLLIVLRKEPASC